jgi:hypothetical protein
MLLFVHYGMGNDQFRVSLEHDLIAEERSGGMLPFFA